ncbi:MAG: hypothetical protein M2R45_03518 [Verrucomicrobia subdivision 3 bacterium]|nr:hypothetical protein [Limisphaerales bacterium]MCS1415915.1 hypothetical protein [Limisphaerales bacterium]
MEAIKRWFSRQLANPQVALLGVLLLIGIVVIFIFGDMLAPFLAAVVIAYLLDGIVLRMQRRSIPRLLAVSIVFMGFLVGILLLSFVLVPSIVNQLQSFVIRDVPRIFRAASTGLETVQDEFRKANFPDLFSQPEEKESETTNTNGGGNATAPITQTTNSPPSQLVTSDSLANESSPDLERLRSAREKKKPASSLDSESESSRQLVESDEESPVESGNATTAAKRTITEPPSDFLESPRLTATLEEEITNLGKTVVAKSIDSFKNLVVWIVYLVLVPVLVFFMLKDKERIIAWLIQFLPKDRSLATQIWHDVNIQTSNYIRGKFWEIILVWSVTHVTFSLFGLNSALLLSLFVGLSVMVPYVGVAIMYVPITLVAFYQFGWGHILFWILVAYTIIQLLDGNVLAPILLSEVTSLHPVAVIVAILIFGGLWGFWGVFFAIPLATLVNAVIKAWPQEFGHLSPGSPPPEK